MDDGPRAAVSKRNPHPITHFNNNLAARIAQSTQFTRAPGAPLFLKELNCNCVNPNQDLVLNLAARSPLRASTEVTRLLRQLPAVAATERAD
jgi:hypothetical protein